MDNLQIETLTKKYVDVVFELEKKLIGVCDKSSIEKSLQSDTLNYYILIILYSNYLTHFIVSLK